MNTGKVVPAFNIPIDGDVYPNLNANYVVVKDGKLMDGERRIRWTGYNAPNYATQEDPDWQLAEKSTLEDIIKTTKQSNAQVVRVYSMGFQILPGFADQATWTEVGASIAQAPKQVGWDPALPMVVPPGTTAPASYTTGDFYLYEPVWQNIDYFLAQADRYGVRVIFPFINRWQWWGGVGAFQHYYGISTTTSLNNYFGTNANSLFMGGQMDRLMGKIMNRVNTYTGLKYKEDPAIMAWESSNEYDGTAADPNWLAKRAEYLHVDEDISQLYQEGYYTQGSAGAAVNTYRSYLASPYIDMVTDHFYDSVNRNYVGAMLPSLRLAKDAGKAYTVGEFGLTSADHIDHLLRALVDNDGDGAMIWDARHRDPRGGFYWHRGDQSAYNQVFYSYRWPGFADNDEFDEAQVVDMLYNYSFLINGQTPVPPPVPDTAPLLFETQSPAAINWRGTTGANAYDVERATSAEGPWAVIGEDVPDSQSVVRDGPLFKDVTTEAGTDYYYRVRGRNVNNPTGYSPYSNIIGPVAGDVHSFGSDILAAQDLDAGFESTTSLNAWAQDSTVPGLSFRASAGTAGITTSEAHSGQSSAQVTNTGELWLKFKVKPLTNYVASFWMKSNVANVKYTVLSRKLNPGVDNGAGDVDPYQYRGPGPSGANNVLAFSDYRDRWSLTNVDKERGNAISGIATPADNAWHYYTVVFAGGELDISKGETEANLVFSNRSAGGANTFLIDDVNVHETMLQNSSFTAFGTRWDWESPWEFHSIAGSGDGANSVAILPAVRGTGKALSQSVGVKPDTDYSLAFLAQNTSNGVKYAILGEDGAPIVGPLQVPGSTAARASNNSLNPYYLRFNSGANERVSVAFYDAQASSGLFRLDEVDLIPAATAAFAGGADPNVTLSPGTGWSEVGGGIGVEGSSSGAEARASITATGHTDYRVRFSASSAVGGVSFRVEGNAGVSQSYRTSALPGVTEYAIDYTTGEGDGPLNLVLEDTAASGQHVFSNFEFLGTTPGPVDSNAVEDGEGTRGAQNLFEDSWAESKVALALDPAHAMGGLYAVRADYTPGATAAKRFDNPLDLSAYRGLTVGLQPADGSSGTLRLTLRDSAGATASYEFPLSADPGHRYVDFPASGFDAGAVAGVRLEFSGTEAGTLWLDDVLGSTPFVIESGEGSGTGGWVRPAVSANKTTQFASGAITSTSDSTNGLGGAPARQVAYSYNGTAPTGGDRSIRTFAQLDKTLGAVTWRDRDALELWVKQGTTTVGAETKVAVRLNLTGGRYAEAQYPLGAADPTGKLVTIPLADFTVYPTGEPFDPSGATIKGASLVFSAVENTDVSMSPTGYGTVGPQVSNDIVYLSNVSAVATQLARPVARPSDRSVALSWQRPTFTGFSGLRVEVFESGGSWPVQTLALDADATRATIADLTNGQEYIFAVTVLKEGAAHARTDLTATPGGSGTLSIAPDSIKAGQDFTAAIGLSSFGAPVFYGRAVIDFDPGVMTPVSAVSIAEGVAVVGVSVVDATHYVIDFKATEVGGYSGSGRIIAVAFTTKALSEVAIVDGSLPWTLGVALSPDESLTEVAADGGTMTLAPVPWRLGAAIAAAEQVYAGGSLAQHPAEAFVELAAAIAAAIALRDDPTAGVEQWNGAIGRIDQARHSFVTASLRALYEAQKSRTRGDLPNAEWQAFLSALQGARTVLDSVGATEGDVSRATSRLAEAVAALAPGVVLGPPATGPVTPAVPTPAPIDPDNASDKQVVAKVKAAQTKVRLVRKQSVTIPALVYLSDGSSSKSVIWRSSNPKVAKVNSTNGKIVALRSGSATVTVKSKALDARGEALSAKVRVTVVAKSASPTKVVSVRASGVRRTMSVGQVAYVTGQYAPAAAIRAKVTYTSSSANTVTVDKAGRVTAKHPGKAVLRVKAGGKTAKYTITVE
jgi:hypothetical protein